VDALYPLNPDIKAAIGAFYGDRDDEIGDGLTRCSLADFVRGFDGNPILPPTFLKRILLEIICIGYVSAWQLLRACSAQSNQPLVVAPGYVEFTRA
jgi:hypothetical protein